LASSIVSDKKSFISVRRPSIMKPMTCIIGLYYDSEKGGMIISDSRIMRGVDYLTEQKIYEIVPELVVFSASGLSGIGNKLIRAVQNRIRTDGAADLEDVVKIVEDETAELWYRYKSPQKPRFPSYETLVDAIIGGVLDEKPKLYHVMENGYAESISNFLAVGDGSRHADNILKTLYNPEITKERAMEIGIHAIIQVSKIDSVVDDSPQLAIIEENKVKLLNMDDKQHFTLYNNKINEIKSKINGIENKRTDVFNLYLNGSDELKRKMDELLYEYRKSKNA